MSDSRAHLEALLRERIVVLDGSWGVLIQREVTGEEAYRGERFRDHPRDVAGDPDLLNLTRPEVVLGIHRDYFAAGADIGAMKDWNFIDVYSADYITRDWEHIRRIRKPVIAAVAGQGVDGARGSRLPVERSIAGAALLSIKGVALEHQTM